MPLDIMYIEHISLHNHLHNVYLLKSAFAIQRKMTCLK